MVSVFHQTYAKYINELSDVSMELIADNIGAQIHGDALIVCFFKRDYRVEKSGISACDGHEIPFSTKVVLCKYVLMAQTQNASTSTQWVTYRDFKDSGPLLTYFNDNATKLLANHFDRNTALLRERVESLGGMPAPFEGYDVSMKISILPKIPMIINYNSSDEEFPAVCSLLFNSNAEDFLDMECLAICGTLFAGKMISETIADTSVE